jgi:hypothetical protein
MGDASSDAHFHLHQPLSGEGDHVAQNVRVGAFSTSLRRSIISSVIGGSSVCVCDSQPEPTEKLPMAAASRSLATAL